ncbi:MAG: hypothetical protein ACTSRS_17470 [Candidatus Helarchaeota archaeon]
MPYITKSGQYERARGIGHIPIIKNDFIQKKLRDFHIVNKQQIENIPDELIFDLQDNLRDQVLPQWILSIDGSAQELAIDDNFPSTRIGYIQLAIVLVTLNKMLDQRKHQFIDPAELKQTINNMSLPIVLPGSNIRERRCTDLQESWRYNIYQIFNEYQLEDARLLDIFWDILCYTGRIDPTNKRIWNNKVRLKRCSATKTCKGIRDVPIDGCICPSCNKQLFPTDSLRIYEEVNDLQSNFSPLRRVMLFLEHLYSFGFIRFLLNRYPEELPKMAFILDSPLAIFGPQAWFHRALFNYINLKIYETLSSKRIEYPIIVGIEKTGSFAEHADLISKYLKSQSLMILTEDYIYRHILSSKPPLSGIYGAETYYGQKLFYKTKDNQIFTITVPLLKKRKLSKEILKHPALFRTLSLLDKIGTKLYKNALIPITLAHSYASIPTRIGTKVLRILTQMFLE